MSSITRFGISMETALLAEFDILIKNKGYMNRSEAIRDLIRDKIISERTEDLEGSVVGIVSLVYAHDEFTLPSKLIHKQHKNYSFIISTLHIHLDEDHCLEVLILKGKSKKVRMFADSLISLKGVKHGSLSMTTSRLTVH